MDFKKSLTANLVRSTMLLTTFLGSNALAAISGNNASQFTTSLQKAINNANAGDVIRIDPGNFKLNASINIDKPITIRGAGRGGSSGTTISQKDNANSMFNLKAKNVTFRDLRLDGKNQIKQVIKPLTFGNGGDGVRGLRLNNVRVQGGTDILVGHPSGMVLSGLNVDNSVFVGGRIGINYVNRKTFKYGSVDPIASGSVENSTFTSPSNTGINIDAANDSNADQKFVVTGTVWRGNTVTDSGSFGVALTNAKGLNIINNNLTAERDAVHVEYRSRDLVIRNNTLKSTSSSVVSEPIRLGVGDTNYYIEEDGEDVKYCLVNDPSEADGCIPSPDRNKRDHNDDHANGSRRVEISGNTLRGTATNGITVIETEEVDIHDNDLRNFTARTGIKIKIAAGRGRLVRQGGINNDVHDNKGVSSAEVDVQAPGLQSQNRE